MTESEKSSAILNLRKPWENNENSVWLASTISLYRNLERYKFPGKLDTDRRKQIVSLLSKDLLATDLLQSPQLIRGEEMSPVEKEYLVEHFLSSQNFIQANVGEAFIIDQSGQFLATINLGDHLHLEVVDCTGEIESAWSKLVQLELLLGKSFSFAFSPKFGFLTADFNQCGTALIVSIYLQIPALIQLEKIDEFLEKNLDESIAITGIQRNPTEIIGDIVVIQNNFKLGVSEENIISNLRAFTTKLIVQENAARREILQSQNPVIKDKVSRALGILIHSYQIEAIESLNALSLLKLGLEMGWVEGIKPSMLNLLFFNSRRSHLLNQLPEKINQEEIIHKRSEYIHKILKDVHLTI
jgi:protein arginine kinase